MARADQPQKGRLVDMSKGMVDVVHPALLDDAESKLLKNASLDEKGTLTPCVGRTERFGTPFDTANPCNGIAAFYPDTTTSRLVMGAGTKLFKDTPHLINRWTDQAQFEESGSVRVNTDTASTPGDVKLKDKPILTFSRSSVAYKQDGTQVAANVPRYETGKFNQAVMVEEGTQNLLKNASFEVYTGTNGVADGWTSLVASGVTASFAVDTTTYRPSGAKSQKIAITASTAAGNAVVYEDVTATAGTTYTFSAYVQGSAAGTGGVALWVGFKASAETTISSVDTGVVIPGSTWQRLTITGTAPTGTAIIRVVPYVRAQVAGDTVTAYFDDAQLEAKSYPTSIIFANDTTTQPSRAAETLTIPTAGVLSPSEGTDEKYVKLFRSPGTNEQFIFDGAGLANQNLQVVVRTDGYVDVRYGTGSATAVITSTTVFVKDTLYAISWRWSSAGVALFINGVSEASSVTAPSLSFGANAYYGSKADGTLQLDGLIDDLRISGRARTDTEISDAYASGVALTADEWTTCLAPFDGNITASDLAGFVWASATKDVSLAVDTASGKVGWQVTTPGTSTVAIETRTSADGVTWDAWTAVLADGTIQSIYQKYIQVRARGLVSGTDKPSVQELTLSYDGTPAAAELSIGFTAGGQFYFATLLSKLVITNKLDAPQVWDGINAVAALGGTPPHAQFVAAHKNYLFMAHTTNNPSRLHFSEVLNIESWPALNFIDISPNDGDWITGLMPYDDYLIITKNRSIWLLVGTGTSDFEVRRLHAEVGCVAPRSLVRVGEAFAFVFHDGIYMSDLSQPVLISERLKKTWHGLNRRRLNQACATFFDHKLRVDVPNGSSTINNLRIIYDSIRKALMLEEFIDHASCYTKFTEAGQEVLLYGHSNEGQVSQADNGSTDAGQPINFVWESKNFDFGLPEHIKRWRKVFMGFAPASSSTVVNVSFVVDGGAASTPIQVTVPGEATKKVHTVRLLPSQVGVVQGHSLGMRVTQSTTNGGVGIHAIILDYFIKGARPTL